jgi:hypothetical protein
MATPPAPDEPTNDRSLLRFESGRPYVDPVIEAYKKDVDRTLIRAMLELTPEERLLALQRALDDLVELREQWTRQAPGGDDESSSICEICAIFVPPSPRWKRNKDFADFADEDRGRRKMSLVLCGRRSRAGEVRRSSARPPGSGTGRRPACRVVAQASRLRLCR